MIPSEIKKQILELCDKFEEPVLFPDHVDLSYNDVTLRWSDGSRVQYTFSIIPIVKNDSKTIELKTKLESTRTKPPTLDISVGVK